MDHLMTSWLGWVAMVGAMWVAFNTTLGLMERPAVRDRLAGVSRGKQLAIIGEYRRGLATVELRLFEGDFHGEPVLMLGKETRLLGGRRASYIRLEPAHADILREALIQAKDAPTG